MEGVEVLARVAMAVVRVREALSRRRSPNHSILPILDRFFL